MTLYKMVVHVATGQQVRMALTADELAEHQLMAARLVADVTEIAADGVDTATVTVISDLDSVTVSVDGGQVVVFPAVDNTLEITSDGPGVIPVTVVGGAASLEIVAVEV